MSLLGEWITRRQQESVLKNWNGLNQLVEQNVASRLIMMAQSCRKKRESGVLIQVFYSFASVVGKIIGERFLLEQSKRI